MKWVRPQMVVHLQRSARSKRSHCFLEFEAIDVEEEEEVTSESDGDDEDEDDGSLRKRRLTIVNEEAAVALALGTEGRGLDPNARRKSHFYGKISRRSRKSSLFNSAAFKTRPPKPRYYGGAKDNALHSIVH